LDAEETNGIHPPANTLPDPLAALFADPATVDRARATAAAAHGDSKKVALPDLVPGFKANPLDASKYLPFTSSIPHRCIHTVAPHRRALH